MHPLTDSDNSDDEDEKSNSEYITLNANHFHPDLPIDSGGVLPLDIHTPPNGGLVSYEDTQQQQECFSQEPHYESTEEEAPAPLVNQEIQIPQLGRQSLLEDALDDMSFLDLPLPHTHEHRVQFREQQSTTTSSRPQREVKQTEKGQQYTQALQQQKDNLTKKR